MLTMRCGLLAALVAVVFATAVYADAIPVTLATFADPGTTSVRFTSTGADTGYLEVWNDNVTLEILTHNQVYHNASFVMTDTAGGTLDMLSLVTNRHGDMSRAVFEGGTLEFRDEYGATIVGFDFDELYLTPLSLQTYANSGNSIEMFGPAATVLDGEESFGFAFGDVDYYGDDLGFDATASFTSSGIPNPEPATMILMGGGASLLAWFARRKYRTSHHTARK